MEIDTGAPSGDRPPADVIGAEPRTGRGRRGAAIAVGAVVLAGGGAAAAVAAGTDPTPTAGSPSPSAGAPSPGTTPTAPGRAHGPGGRHGLGGLGGALHGTLTVPGAGGTYEEVLVQRGTVTAVSPTSLAVKSADGYTHTYVLDDSTVVDGKAGDSSSLAVDDTVGVLAAGDSTARSVTERRAEPASPDGTPEGRRRHGPGHGDATPDGVAPSPSTSPSTGGSSRTVPGATSGGTDA